jgi:hypothetical protein
MPPASRRTTLCPTLTWGRKNVARFRQLLSVLVSWNVPKGAEGTTGFPTLVAGFGKDSGWVSICECPSYNGLCALFPA